MELGDYGSTEDVLNALMPPSESLSLRFGNENKHFIALALVRQLPPSESLSLRFGNAQASSALLSLV